MKTTTNLNINHPAFATGALSCALLFISSFHLQNDAGNSPADAGAALERAKIAEELGELDKAENLLKSAANASSVSIANDAKARLAAIDRKLGRIQAPASKPAVDNPSMSPVERRVSEEIARYEKGIIKDEALRGVISGLGESALPAVARYVTDPSTQGATRDELVRAMGYNPCEKMFTLLEQWVNTGDELLRRSAINVITSQTTLSPPNVEIRNQVALRLVTHPSGQIRATVVGMVGNWVQSDILNDRIDMLVKDPDFGVRVAVARSLGQKLSKAQMDALVRDTSESVRSAAAEAICNGRWTGGVDYLSILLNDASAQVRANTATMMGNRDWSATDQLKFKDAFEKAANDASPAVRRAAVNSSRRALGDGEVPMLLMRLTDPVAEIRVLAIQVAGYDSTRVAREHIPLARQAIIDYVNLAGFPHEQAGTNTPMSLRSFLGRLIYKVSGHQDLAEFLQLFAAVPELMDLDSSLIGDVLEKSSAADLPIICELWTKIKTVNSRSRVLNWLSRTLPKISAKDAAVATPIVREMLQPGADRELRQSAIFAAMNIADESLAKDVVNNFDAVETAWRGVLKQIRVVNERSHKFAISVLLEYLKRGPSEENRNTKGTTAFHDAAGILFNILKSDEIDDVVALVTDREYRAKVTAANEYNSLEEMIAAVAAQPANSALPALLKIWNADTPLRPTIIGNISETAGAEGIQFLRINGLAAEEENDRSWAVSRLNQLRAFGPDVVKSVTALANDKNRDVRVSVAEYCKAWNSPQAVPVAQKLMKDADNNVRRAAASALGRLLAEEAAPDLIQGLADDDDGVRGAAKEALEQIKLYHSEKVSWEDWYKKRGLDPGDGVKKLIDMMEDPAMDVRIAAIESLASMKIKEVLPMLVEKLKKAPSGAERESIAKAIAKLNQ
ncbi:MAG: HEAT repeat domain-containing protein [Planctomycetes bacterium]|nr:HEAT repeat domain-containing protein [Planctomycetota bacterium]